MYIIYIYTGFKKTPMNDTYILAGLGSSEFAPVGNNISYGTRKRMQIVDTSVENQQSH